MAYDFINNKRRLMKPVKKRTCPTCSRFIPNKSYKRVIKWCKGGCSKLVCQECSVFSYCTDCYISMHKLRELYMYNHDKKINL